MCCASGQTKRSKRNSLPKCDYSTVAYDSDRVPSGLGLVMFDLHQWTLSTPHPAEPYGQAPYPCLKYNPSSPYRPGGHCVAHVIGVHSSNGRLTPYCSLRTALALAGFAAVLTGPSSRALAQDNSVASGVQSRRPGLYSHPSVAGRYQPWQRVHLRRRIFPGSYVPGRVAVLF